MKVLSFFGGDRVKGLGRLVKGLGKPVPYECLKVSARYSLRMSNVDPE